MSDPTKRNLKGRYNGPVPFSNLEEEDADELDWEPFELDDDDSEEGSEEASEATPRFWGGRPWWRPRPPPQRPPPQTDTLSVIGLDMCQSLNKPKHRTQAYETDRLVVRRGEEFQIRINFNRPLRAGDDFQIEFKIGSNPSARKGSLVVVTCGGRRGGLWAGREVQKDGNSVVVGVTPTADAIVGKWRTIVACTVGRGLQRKPRDPDCDVYILFNAWCREDSVYMPNERERMEYVLNDYGVIYQGDSNNITHRSWNYGQFEPGILDACISLLDGARMPIYDRCNCIKLVRKASAVLNSQDDSGVLVGNWSDDFSMGTSPTLWIGSTNILLQYANSHTPVCYGQCWVFAGVFNTMMRSLGIPSRVITNFSSAHDNTGNLKCDLVFKSDGSPDRRNTSDSIWNYHCWNEAYMARPDLPAGLSGWQVCDATPQETSEGYFCCGPASVNAIKSGLLSHPYDAGFCFAEVNSDVVFLKQDKYGGQTIFNVDKTHVGQAIITKSVGSDRPNNIIGTYKHPEGSRLDQDTMDKAEEYGCQRDHAEQPDSGLSVTMSCDKVPLGQDVNLLVDFRNESSSPQTVKAHLCGAVCFYTGVVSKEFYNHSFSCTVQPFQAEHVPVKISSQEYLSHLGDQLTLNFCLTGGAQDQTVSAIKVVNLQTPPIIVTASGQPTVNEEMVVTCSFTNPFPFALEKVYMAMEGCGLISYRTRLYNTIPPYATAKWQESFVPKKQGPRRIVAGLDCYKLRQVTGTCDIVIT